MSNPEIQQGQDTATEHLSQVTTISEEAIVAGVRNATDSLLREEENQWQYDGFGG
jgi:hypothetical protein